MPNPLRSRLWGFAAVLALALLVANIVAQPSFGDPSNWPSELAALAPFAIIALASTPAILSGGGGLDISVGPTAVLVNVVAVSWLSSRSGLNSAWVDLPLLLALGALIGLINGTLVAVLRYRPIIATLCMFFVLTGVIQAVASSPASAPARNWTVELGASVGPVPGGVILMAIPLAVWWVLSRTAFHRNLYAVGGNDATAFSSGVRVWQVRVGAYVLGGVFAAVAGIALTALVQSSQPATYSEYTLIAFAAVALGGASFAGGRGGLVGSLCGAMCIYLLQTLLSAVSVPSSWLNFVYGALLVIGVIVGAKLVAVRGFSGARA